MIQKKSNSNMQTQNTSKIGDPLADLAVGHTDSVNRTISTEDVDAFVRLSGDRNALHTDDEFAARTEFEQRVVHGFLHASLLSTLVGMKIPGHGALYLSQTMDFVRPVFIGDRVVASGTISKIDSVTRVITLDTEIVNQHGNCVLRGTAKVKVLRLIDENSKRQTRKTASMKNLLTGKVALVTGASRGIGRGIARILSLHGADVWINYHRSEKAAEQLALEIKELGGSCHTIQANVTDKSDTSRMINQIAQNKGLHILVNNAGPKIHSAPFDKLTWADMQSAIEKTVGSVFNVTQAALPSLKEKRGKIINVLSSATQGRTTHNWMPYVTAKSALLGLSKNLAQELGPSRVTVNMVSPSIVDTDLVANIPEKIRQLIVGQTPLRRMATVEDVAGAVLLLCSPYADFITGDNLLVTGGEVMS